MMGLFEKYFRQVIKEDLDEDDEELVSTTRIGPDGVEVQIPAGWLSHFGKDGRIVPLHPSSTFREDVTGRVIEVKKGWSYRENSKGGIAVPPGGTVRERKDGKLILDRRLSNFEALKRSEMLKRRYGQSSR